MHVEKLAEEIEDLPAPVAILNPQGTILALNKEGRIALTGTYKGVAKLIGTSMLDRVVPEQRTHMANRLTRSGEGEELPRSSRWRITLLDGSVTTVRTKGRKISDNGNTVFQVVFSLIEDEIALSDDIAQRLAKAIERIEERSLAQADWLASARLATLQTQEQVNIHSHQINTLVLGLERVEHSVHDVVAATRDFLDRDPLEAS